MALFTDPQIITLDDLLEYENTLVQVSTTHNIDVDTKITLAIGGIGDKLMLWLLSVGASDPQWLNRRTLGLSTVVVTPVLQRWLRFEALSRFFAEAYNVQLNTRFQAKWTEYQQLARDAANMVFMSGLGIVANPLARPAMPTVSIQPGLLPSQALFVQTTWVDSFGAESAPSTVNGTVLQAASALTVSMAQSSTALPASASGWNIYASSTADNLTLQNADPLAIGTSWQFSGTLIDGSLPGDGQQPTFYVLLSNQIQRG